MPLEPEIDKKFTLSATKNGAIYKVRGYVGTENLAEKVKVSSQYDDPKVKQIVLDNLVLARRRIDRFFLSGALLITGGVMREIPELNDDLAKALAEEKLIAGRPVFYRDLYGQDLFDAKDDPNGGRIVTLTAPFAVKRLNSYKSATGIRVITFGESDNPHPLFDTIKTALAIHLDKYVLKRKLPEDVRHPFGGVAVTYQRMRELRSLGINGTTSLEALQAAQTINQLESCQQRDNSALIAVSE